MMNTISRYISFPGLGIEPFQVDPVAFTLFGRPVMWYGVIICVGMILAFCYAYSRAKIEKVKTDDLMDLTIFLILFGVLGARLYYVLFTLDSYIVEGDLWKTLYEMIAVWNGGLAIYGGVIAGFLTILVFSKVKKMRFSTLLDIAAPSVMLGQLIGRWGNFINMEAYGGETTLPWRMGVLKSYDGAATFVSESYVHPTFLYESIWNLVGFIIITALYKKKKFNGQIFFMYITWYGLGRAWIEGLRTDSLMLGPIRVSQLLAAVTFVIGAVLLAVNFINLKRYNKMKAECAVAENEQNGDGECADTVTETDNSATETACDSENENTEDDSEDSNTSESESEE